MFGKKIISFIFSLLKMSLRKGVCEVPKKNIESLINDNPFLNKYYQYLWGFRYDLHLDDNITAYEFFDSEKKEKMFLISKLYVFENVNGSFKSVLKPLTVNDNYYGGEIVIGILSDKTDDFDSEIEIGFGFHSSLDELYLPTSMLWPWTRASIEIDKKNECPELRFFGVFPRLKSEYAIRGIAQEVYSTILLQMKQNEGNVVFSYPETSTPRIIYTSTSRCRIPFI